MRVSFPVVSELQCFSIGGTLRYLESSKQSPRPFLPSPICVLFTEHEKATVRGETADVSPQLRSNASLTGSTVLLVTHIQGMGFETDCVLNGFHSAVIHVRMRFQGRNIHSWQPHLASEHLCLLCCLGGKKNTLQKPVALPEDTSNTC